MVFMLRGKYRMYRVKVCTSFLKRKENNDDSRSDALKVLLDEGSLQVLNLGRFSLTALGFQINSTFKFSGDGA